MKNNPVIVNAHVANRTPAAQQHTRTERDLIRRHQAALRELERWDCARELRPHTPRLAREILQRDDALHWESPVFRAMMDQAGPLAGPRTGTHPMAERVEPPPMATPIQDPPDWGELVALAITVVALIGLVMMTVNMV